MENDNSKLFQFIGHTFKHARTLKNLRQADVAEEAGVTLRHYQRIESGTLRNITIETLLSISHVLEVDVFKSFEKLTPQPNKDDTPECTHCDYTDEINNLLSTIEMPKDLDKFNQIHKYIFSHYDFDRYSDIDGMVWGFMNYPSPASIERYHFDKKFSAGKHSIEPGNVSILTFLAPRLGETPYFSKHVFMFDDKKHQFATMIKTLGTLESKPVFVYAARTCPKDCPHNK